MRSNTWRAIMLLTLTLVLVSSAMEAQAARRSSLAGNQFINDPDDMFAFPQLMMKYKNRLIIDMAPSGGDEGNGSIVFGDNWVWNFNTGRGDYLNNTAFWAGGGFDRISGIMSVFNGTPGSNGSNGRSLEWWDLGFATHLGDTPFGFNVSWATDKDKETPPVGDPTQDNSTSMLSFQVGTTLGSIELAGEVGFGSYSDELVGLDPSDVNDWDFFNFSLLARGNLDDFGGQNWRWIAAYTNGSNDPNFTDTANNIEAVKLTTTGFRGSFGPVWGTPGEWEVAAYLNFNYLKHDSGNFGNPETKDSISFTSFPAYNFAMEYYLNSWLVARGGVMSQNVALTETDENPGDPITEDEGQFREDLFMWTLGLGVDKGNWGLDIALEEDDVHSGYLPLNGDVSDSPIAYLTAWLSW
ncbi:MAG: hypothetical protein KAH56_12715 [Candidatus Krumholzibacteria bacterium]|nr:hypothetical protein [Candidatus Krumholzibacteria bacterium]